MQLGGSVGSNASACQCIRFFFHCRERLPEAAVFCQPRRKPRTILIEQKFNIRLVMKISLYYHKALLIALPGRTHVPTRSMCWNCIKEVAHEMCLGGLICSAGLGCESVACFGFGVLPTPIPGAYRHAPKRFAHETVSRPRSFA